MDARVAVEPLCLRLAAEVFVIAQTGKDGRFEPTELLVHPLVAKWPHAAVDDVASHENHVGLLIINKVNPSRELFPAVVIAEVQVAHQHQLDGLRYLRRAERHLLTILVAVVDVAVNEKPEEEEYDAAGGPPIVAQSRGRQQMQEPRDVEHDEKHREVEEDDDARRSHLVNRRRHGHRQAVRRTEDAGEKHGERAHHQQDNEGFPTPREGEQQPDMPADIREGQQRQQQKQQHHHFFNHFYLFRKL